MSGKLYIKYTAGFIMKNVTLNSLKKKFSKKDRHVRWNWERHPEYLDLVRYHFVIVDDKYRELKIEKIKDKFNSKSIINYSFDTYREVEGKVENTYYRYLFVSLDTKAPDYFLDFNGISNNVKKDDNLRERKRGNIEDYVADLYSK